MTVTYQDPVGDEVRQRLDDVAKPLSDSISYAAGYVADTFVEDRDVAEKLSAKIGLVARGAVFRALREERAGAADINPAELIGAEFAKCRAAEADPRAVDVLVDALGCTLEEHGFAVVALEDAEAIKRHGARRLYPDELSDELRHVLGFANFRCMPFAHLMRKAGIAIKEKAEDEQAVVLHWLVRLVLDHGAHWASAGDAQLGAFKAQIAAAAKATAGGGA